MVGSTCPLACLLSRCLCYRSLVYRTVQHLHPLSPACRLRLLKQCATLLQGTNGMAPPSQCPNVDIPFPNSRLRTLRTVQTFPFFFQLLPNLTLFQLKGASECQPMLARIPDWVPFLGNLLLELAFRGL